MKEIIWRRPRKRSRGAKASPESSTTITVRSVSGEAESHSLGGSTKAEHHLGHIGYVPKVSVANGFSQFDARNQEARGYPMSGGSVNLVQGQLVLKLENRSLAKWVQ